jgi:ribonuclease HI
MRINVYSDGSAQTADKPGGYGWVITTDDTKHSEGSGHMELATNNDAELEAAVQGLKAARKLIDHNRHLLCLSGAEQDQIDRLTKSDVTLCSDSEIVLGWSNGTYRFKQEKKIEKYNELRELVTNLNVKTRWIKGHSGHIHQERCDKLANIARLNLPKPEAETSAQSLIGRKKDSIASIWYDGQLFILDFSQKVIEAYSRELHGKRGSSLEIRKEKNR